MAADRVPYEPISWRDGRLRLLDQTLLPGALEYRVIDSLEDAAEAISSMRVRGAPAIGIAAAYALALVAASDGSAEASGVSAAVERAAATLAATRPTAVNLRWALDRVRARVAAAAAAPEARVEALEEAQLIHEQQREADQRMTEAGAALIVPDSTVLTHCNAGPLATGGYGTALGVIIEAHRRGLVTDVLVDETRPRLQGMRLTAWELAQHGVPHHVIADGAAASLMAAGRISAALVGADRIAPNGDTANKIGTYALALAALHHGVPLYVVAPTSTIDAETASGGAIPVERRDEAELLTLDGAPLAPEGSRALNPAFDVTPGALIAAIVTERGVLRPPYGEAIARAVDAVPATAGSGRA